MSVAEKLVDYEVLKREPDVVVAELRPFVFANGGVKAIRELMLELAVTGKLTERLHDDDSAAAHLDEIAAARQTLAASLGARIKTSKQADARTRHADWPCEWATTSVGNLGVFLGGGTPSKQNPAYWEGDIPWVSPKDMKRPYIEDAIDHVSVDGVESSSARMIPRDSVLMVIRGMILDHSFPVAVSERDLTINQDMKALVLAMPASREFVLLVLQAFKRRVLSLVQRSSHGTCRLPIDDVANLAFPLPPLAEQKRIVSKVDRLMGICDRLESERRKTLSLTDRSRRSVLASLTSSRHASELASSWRRLSDHFEILHDRPETLADLRQTILALAVQGKLVKQDPDDEPASMLVPQIESRRRELVSAGTISRNYTIRDTSLPEQELPVGWIWQNFGDITFNRDGARVPVRRSDREQQAKKFDYYGASGIIDKVADYLFDQPLLLIGEDGANLINRSSPIAFIARGKYWVNNHAHVVDALTESMLEYLRVFINSINLEKYITGTAQPKMNQARMNSIPVALPPLAEQSRIVAKVDRLLVQCDRVAEQLRDRQATTEQLLTATIHRILATSAPE